MVALQLNLIDEARDLYAKCGRFDLLANMLAAQGDWDEAVEIAQKNSRINLKNLYYRLGIYFEQVKDYDLAIHNYVKSDCHRVEVPRMLCKNNLFDKLI